MLSSTCLALLLPAPVAAAQPRVAPDVFILAGQSNMSGRGLVAELNPVERAPDPTVRLYGNDGRWRVAVEPLDNASGQVDAVSADRQAGVGPGLFFTRALRRHAGAPIGLVPCAKDGTSIVRWSPASGRDTLYGSCAARVREAGGHVSGLLWYQGESDAERIPADAASWGDAFMRLVTQVRRDLDAPRLPVVFVQIADRPGRPPDAARYPGWEAVRLQQAHLTGDCIAMIRSEGLPRREDDLHLTTAAQRILGSRLAGAMNRLQRAGCGR